VDKFLVDSDIIIWYLKGREKEAKLLEELSRKGELYLSVVTIAEIRAGLTRKAAEIIDELENVLIPVDLTSEIAELAGAFKQKYKLDIADMFIAATCVTSGLTLVTYNKKHFPMPKIKLYTF
jgi:predicted nucleic acid-binding protein